MWRALFICELVMSYVTWLIYMSYHSFVCDMTDWVTAHASQARDSFMCGMTHLCSCSRKHNCLCVRESGFVRERECARTHESELVSKRVSVREREFVTRVSSWLKPLSSDSYLSARARTRVNSCLSVRVSKCEREFVTRVSSWLEWVCAWERVSTPAREWTRV